MIIYFTEFLNESNKPHGYWTKEKCQEVALECKTRSEFSKKYPGAYDSCFKNGWLDEVSKHMINGKIYWTKNKCLEVALDCETRSDFRIKYSSAYYACLKNNWLDDINLLIPETEIESRLIWTKTKCKNKALKCSSRSEFNKKYSSAYYSAYNNGWLDEICQHMEVIKKPNGYWTFEKCKEFVLKCKDKQDFYKKYPYIYSLCSRNGWLKDIFKHLEKTEDYFDENYWTLDRCIDIAWECKSMKQLYLEYRDVYNAVKRNGWVNIMRKNFKRLEYE